MSSKSQRSSKAEETGERSHLHYGICFFIGVFLIVIGVLFPKLFISKPEIIDKYYTNGIFKLVRAAIGALPSLVDVSISEVVIFALVVAFLTLITVTVIKLCVKTFKLKRFLAWFCSIVFTASILLNLFNLVWGLNYRSTALAAKLELEVTERTPTQLYGMCVNLRAEANSLRTQVPQNDDGVFTIENPKKYFTKIASDAETCAAVNSQGLVVHPAKAVSCSEIMSYLGISGMYMPFFAEANVNITQPSLLMLSSAAHENAHSLGIAREDEANFCAYLICKNSDDTSIQYSGVMLALMYAASRLHSVDKSLYNELVNGYSNQVTNDLLDYYDYLDRYDTFIDDLSSAANDSYLKYNGTQSGEASYGEMVDLLLADYAKNNTVVAPEA